MNRRTEMLVFRWCAAHHFIVLFAAFLLLGMISGYVIAVAYEHVPALFPYISDTGTRPPASCVFGMLMNMAAMSVFVVVVIRHLHVERYNGMETHRIHVVNDVAKFFGFLSAFGAMLVANFQELNVLSVHVIGALMCFGFGIAYCWMHAYLTWQIHHAIGGISKRLVVLRFLLAVVPTLFCVTTFVGGGISQKAFKTRISNHTFIEFNKNDPGYDAHLVSTFSEWIMVISFMCYFLTFYTDFKFIDAKLHVSHRVNMSLVTPVAVMETGSDNPLFDSVQPC